MAENKIHDNTVRRREYGFTHCTYRDSNGVEFTVSLEDKIRDIILEEEAKCAAEKWKKTYSQQVLAELGDFHKSTPRSKYITSPYGTVLTMYDNIREKNLRKRWGLPEKNENIDEEGWYGEFLARDQRIRNGRRCTLIYMRDEERWCARHCDEWDPFIKRAKMMETVGKNEVYRRLEK